MSILIFDLDGVVWHSNVLIDPKIPHTIKALQKKNHEVYFLTNNSTRSQYGYQKKLARMGIKVKLGQIICTANATRIYLEKRIRNFKRTPVVFVVGEKPFKKEIAKLNVRFAGIDDEKKVDYVIVGVDWHFTYQKLARAMTALLEKAEFIATNTDKTLPVKNKKARPGCGAIISAISTASNVKPFVIGKPSPLMIKNVLGCKLSDKKNIYIIGDRLDTDIVLANRIGVHSVAVLSGATTPDMIKKAKGFYKPQFVLKNMTEVEKIL